MAGAAFAAVVVVLLTNGAIYMGSTADDPVAQAVYFVFAASLFAGASLLALILLEMERLLSRLELTLRSGSDEAENGRGRDV